MVKIRELPASVLVGRLATKECSAKPPSLRREFHHHMNTKSSKETTAALSSQPATVWRATIDKMPPPPDVLHVRGQVEVPNPGVDVFLNRRNPQGTNPTILLLDLVLVQQPGQWPQVLVTKLATYEEKERRPRLRNGGDPCGRTTGGFHSGRDYPITITTCDALATRHRSLACTAFRTMPFRFASLPFLEAATSF